MIEAYEIGIKLALQDGISDGIAAIRRDLGSLDQAIAQTALRLDALQRIGAQALAASQGRVEQAVSGPPPRRPAAVTVPLPPPGEPGTLAPPSPIEVAPVGPTTRASAARVPASAPVPASSALMPSGEAGPASQPVSPRLDVVVAPAVVRPATPAAEVAQGVTGPKLPERLPVAPVPRTVLPGEPGGGGPGVVRQVVPELRATGFVAPAGERSQGRVLQPTIPGVAPLAPTSRAPVAPHTSAEAAARLPQVRTGETRGVRLPQPAAVPDVSTTRMPPVPGVPAALTPPVSPAASRPAPSYAPPASSSRAKESSMRGDVFLDGARVGRWMSEQMARDAGRPNTGPTGFDPRRSAAWPGAAVTW